MVEGRIYLPSLLEMLLPPLSLPPFWFLCCSLCLSLFLPSFCLLPFSHSLSVSFPPLSPSPANPPNEAQSRQDAFLLHMQTDLSQSQISLYCSAAPNLFQAFSLRERQGTRESGREGGVQRGADWGRPTERGKGTERERNRRKVRRPTCVYRNLQCGWERWRRSFTNWPGLSVPKWSLYVFHTVCKQHKRRGAMDKATSRHAPKVVLLWGFFLCRWKAIGLSAVIFSACTSV